MLFRMASIQGTKSPRGTSTPLLLLLLAVYVGGDNIKIPTPVPYNSTVGSVWPRPQKQDLQDQYVTVLDTFRFTVTGSSCDVLDEAVDRYTALLKTNWRHVTKYDLINRSPSIVGAISTLEIHVKTPCEKYPHVDMDEKYSLEIKKGNSILEADSIWGALRGLETFCQLPAPSFKEDQLLIQVQKVEDFPQYPHRGLLIDTSRHYLSVHTIKRQLEVMSYNKLNVLHWHIVDDQSFPYQSKKFPSLSEQGAFDPHAVYTEDNIEEIVEHARLRGIRVIPEFDTPGHTDSISRGMPHLNCHVPYPFKDGTFVGPLDPTENFTFDFVHDLLTEVHERFPDSYVHLGGDEVDSYCWSNNPKIKAFMDARHWQSSQLQSYYMQRILKDVKTMSSRAIVWEEVFKKWQNLSGSSPELSDVLDKDTIVHLWKGDKLQSVKEVVQQGYKVITSNGWYLDHLSKDFKEFYSLDISAANLTEDENKFVLGGEACMWGEKVDDTNIESRVWPRACAIAENLWSAHHQKTDHDNMRITEHVCRLRRRGIQAAPSHEISYCSDVLPRTDYGIDGRLFTTMNTMRASPGHDHDRFENEEVYEIVNNRHNSLEKSANTSTAEKTHASTAERNPSADAPVTDKSAAPLGTRASLLLLISSPMLMMKSIF